MIHGGADKLCIHVLMFYFPEGLLLLYMKVEVNNVVI